MERLVFIEKSTIEKNVKQKESKEVDELEIQRTITENKEVIMKLNQQIDIHKDEEEKIETLWKIYNFFNKGNCWSGNQCAFYHPEKICDMFEEQEVCLTFPHLRH